MGKVSRRLKELNGTCCSCEYDGVEETKCLAREDQIHCVHWWEGTEEENG